MTSTQYGLVTPSLQYVGQVGSVGHAAARHEESIEQLCDGCTLFRGMGLVERVRARIGTHSQILAQAVALNGAQIVAPNSARVEAKLAT